MERKHVAGEKVIYVDEFGNKRDALITKWWGGASLIPAYVSETGELGCNLVYVTNDPLKTDSYGDQLERATSVVHKSKQIAHGRYYMFTDEV